MILNVTYKRQKSKHKNPNTQQESLTEEWNKMIWFCLTASQISEALIHIKI